MTTLSSSTLSVADLFKNYSSSVDGVSSSVALKRLAQMGPNELKRQHIGPAKIFLRQFSSPFIALLVVAAGLSILLGMPIDGGMILLFIVINTVLGFYQEYRSERSLEALEQFISQRVCVRRSHAIVQIPSRDIVTGDILMLEPGDRVAADARLISERDLLVDESVLSGESAPIHKHARVLSQEPPTLLKAPNMLFAGTTIVEGRAEAMVVATGGQMMMGEIATLATTVKRESGFEKGIRSISYLILKIVIVTLVLVFVANLFLKGDQANTIELIIFSIALAVSVIPEALPIVMTFSLSRGALELARKRVVVKRLSAVEDLGSMEVLCTDKTGTLTQNRLRISAIWGTDPHRVVIAGAAAGESPKGSGAPINSFDRAIHHKMTREQKRQFLRIQRIDELPFDPIRRRNSVVIEEAGKRTLIVRGALEELLKTVSIKTALRKELESWAATQGRLGRRVIAIGVKIIGVQKRYTITDEQSGVEMLGLISFVDPIKPSTIKAVAKAKRLGLTIKILTGDSPDVAGAVAYRIGLVSSPSDVLTGDAFEALSGAEQLNAVERYNVFARVSPKQKYRVIELLERTHEVGYLGEGINDAPALKIANVGLVVDHASDVAREAADIVLLDKSLDVIVQGIEEGRMIFANTVKYIKSTLASNFGNFYTVAIASLFINFLPMLPIQILLVNLLSDFPMIAVATDTVDHRELTRPRRYDIREIASIATVLGIVSSVFDFLVFAAFFRMGPEVLQTNWFIASILTELVFMYCIRTRRFMFSARRPSGMLLWLTGVAAIATIIIPFTGVGREVFHFLTPAPMHLLIIGVIVVLYVVATEIVKSAYYRHVNH